MGTIRRPGFLRTVVLLAVATALFLPQSFQRAAEVLPARISDEAFWQMIADFSEDGGPFISENFVSNERGYSTLIPRLQTIVKPGGVYMGVGPEQNFHYIAALRPKMAFIIDIRRQNLIQHLMYKAAFEMSSDRADFLSRIFSRRRPEGLGRQSSAQELFDSYQLVRRDPELAGENLQAIKELLKDRHKFSLSPEDDAKMEHVVTVFSLYGPSLNYSSNIGGFSAGGNNNVSYADIMTQMDADGANRSFLASEESFAHIKEMQQNNLIVPLVGDFGGTKAIKAVGQYVRDHGSIVGVFYLSNVEQYLFQPRINAPNGGPGNFYSSVAALPIDDSSTFIRSGNRNFTGPGRGLTPLMSRISEVLRAFSEGRITSQADVLSLSLP